MFRPRSFSQALTLRVVLLAAAIGGAWYAYFQKNTPLTLVLGATSIALSWHLFQFVNDINRRLTRFFESVRYSDFAIRFASGKERGESFEAVNREFNEVLEAFRKTRAEKEANLLFLNTLVQHLSTGILAFDTGFHALVSNNAAFQLLGVYRLHHLHDLPAQHTELAQFVSQLKTKGKLLYQPEPGRQIAVQGVCLNLQGRPMSLLTLQNIHPELQRKEVDAWRDLTRVLRHEMMNSITPIVSLVDTAREIVRHDLPPSESASDLSEALDIVATRSRSLMDFVEAYRNFTSVPAPRLTETSLQKIFARVGQLAAPELKASNIAWNSSVQPPDLVLLADAGQLEMVLLNLIKNAREALADQAAAQIQLTAGLDTKGRPFIVVEDNGPGIAAELLEEIFIPFFTTKLTGTGVGLSISRQIMQLHGGDLRVQSTPGQGSKFILEF
jgi:two-component system, NtrC family, nitrogen regulation sensor histidine kinase NtrY